MVSTQDFDSCSLSSILGRATKKFKIMIKVDSLITSFVLKVREGNPEDHFFLKDKGLFPKDRLFLIRGIGFSLKPDNKFVRVCLLTSRVVNKNASVLTEALELRLLTNFFFTLSGFKKLLEGKDMLSTIIRNAL